MMEMPYRSDREHVKALYWRVGIMKLSRAALAELTGFSVSTIVDMEKGMNRSTKADLDPCALKRYRMVCAAVTMGCRFDWLSCKMMPDVPLEIRLLR